MHDAHRLTNRLIEHALSFGWINEEIVHVGARLDGIVDIDRRMCCGHVVAPTRFGIATIVGDTIWPGALEWSNSPMAGFTFYGETTRMMQTDAVADGLWTVVRALPDEARERFLEKVLADAALREEIEDLLDLAMAEERSHEPSQPLADVLTDLVES